MTGGREPKPPSTQWIHTSAMPPEGLCSQADMELYDMLWMQIGLDGEVSRDDQLKAAAKRLCMRCPLLVSCLARNLLVPMSHGIFGGMTFKERQYARHVVVIHQVITRRRRRDATELRRDFGRLSVWLEAHPEIHSMVRNRRHNERYRAAHGTGPFPVRIVARLEYAGPDDGKPKNDA